MPASSQPRVIIFTSSSCPWCNRVKQYLRQKRFRFREVNVERDPEGARELRRRNIRGVISSLSLVSLSNSTLKAGASLECYLPRWMAYLSSAK